MGDVFTRAFVDELSKLGAHAPSKKENEGFTTSKLKVIPRSFLARFMKSVVMRNLKPF